MRRVFRILGRILLGLLVILVLLAGASAVANAGRARGSADPETLSALAQARLTEAIRLRQAVGDAIWPGWGAADIPLVIYNESYAFLINHDGPPPAGWVEVPSLASQGGPWTVVPDVTVVGRLVYRQPLATGDRPQAFALRVGERWAAGMTTLEWSRIGLANQIESELPGFLRPIFPYGLFVNQLINSTDHYIALVSHESMHAWQGIQAGERLSEAEQLRSEVEDDYPWGDPALTAAWQVELDLLAEALRAESVAAQRALALDFLQQRDNRRAAADLSPALIQYERAREWVEGGGKYAELAIWQAGAAADASPAAGLADDRDFDSYRRADRQWSREIDQLRRMADDDGDGRFYYTGWAQGALLDQLAPGWQADYFERGATFETLLRAAVDG